MIVLRSEYEQLLRAHRVLQAQHQQLLDSWNTLVTEINSKGGRQFLDGKTQTLLTRDDIKRLLVLCHPDKHNGKRIAEEMTQKLLALRQQVSG